MSRCLFLILWVHASVLADTKDAEILYQRAISAYTAGKVEEAVNLFEEAIDEDPRHVPSYLARGYIHQYNRDYQHAVDDFSKVIELEPGRTETYFRRAVEYFNLGQFKQSVADFETFARLVPEQKPHLWQLGISYYYTGQYQDGRELFESHQSVNQHDVENAVWHFLCVAGLEGFEAAQRALISLDGDGRVPMMQVYALFKGVGSEEAVLKAAHEGTVQAGELIRQSFYAHLYLGLYYQAKGDQEKALQNVRRAAQHYKENGYMGQVARVHRDWLKNKMKAEK